MSQTYLPDHDREISKRLGEQAENLIDYRECWGLENDGQLEVAATVMADRSGSGRPVHVCIVRRKDLLALIEKRKRK